MTNCKNCNNEFEGHYCNQCGQPAETHAMNVHFLVHDIQHGFFHVEKGILFTIKELFTKPGHSIREYIQGKRVKHFKPISLVLLLAGILGLLFHYFHFDIPGYAFKVNGTGHGEGELRESFNKVNEWISGHYALLSLLLLPVFSLGTFLSFRKKGYNFVEHLVLNAFLTSQRLALQIVLFPFYSLLNGTNERETLTEVIILVVFFLTFWTLVQFFNTQKKSTVFWRTLLSFIISGALYLLLAFVGMVLVFFNTGYIKID